MNTAEMLNTIAENEPKIYEKGKTDKYNEFVGAITKQGTRTNFQYGFTQWSDFDFSFLEGVKISNAFWMFSYGGVTDLDFDIDLSNASSANNAFYECLHLKRIKKIILKNSGAGTTANMFYSCKSLEDVRFEGAFNNSVDFSACPLDAFSILGDLATEEQIASGKNLFYFGSSYYYGGIMGALIDSPIANATVTFKKSVVEQHFSGTESDMWLALVGSKPNWNFATKD